MMIIEFMELIFSAKTKLSDKLNLQLAGRYDKYPEVGESSSS